MDLPSRWEREYNEMFTFTQMCTLLVSRGWGQELFCAQCSKAKKRAIEMKVPFANKCPSKFVLLMGINTSSRRFIDHVLVFLYKEGGF